MVWIQYAVSHFLDKRKSTKTTTVLILPGGSLQGWIESNAFSLAELTYDDVWGGLRYSK